MIEGIIFHGICVKLNCTGISEHHVVWKEEPAEFAVPQQREQAQMGWVLAERQHQLSRKLNPSFGTTVIWWAGDSQFIGSVHSVQTWESWFLRKIVMSYSKVNWRNVWRPVRVRGSVLWQPPHRRWIIKCYHFGGAVKPLKHGWGWGEPGTDISPKWGLALREQDSEIRHGVVFPLNATKDCIWLLLSTKLDCLNWDYWKQD